jgi:hypothetical protein
LEFKVKLGRSSRPSIRREPEQDKMSGVPMTRSS